MIFKEMELGENIRILDIVDNNKGHIYVRVCGCSIVDTEVTLDVGSASINNIRTIEDIPDSMIEVAFESFFSYYVEKNTSQLGDSNDTSNLKDSKDCEDLFEGRLFRQYSKSCLLNSIRNKSDPLNNTTVYKHYALVGLDRIVHVVTRSEANILGL